MTMVRKMVTKTDRLTEWLQYSIVMDAAMISSGKTTIQFKA